MQNVEIESGLLCVRVRRSNRFSKKKIMMFHKGIQQSDIRLYIGTRLLDDKSNVHDQDIKNNTLIHYKLKKGTTGEWEQFPDLGI